MWLVIITRNFLCYVWLPCRVFSLMCLFSLEHPLSFQLWAQCLRAVLPCPLSRAAGKYETSRAKFRYPIWLEITRMYLDLSSLAWHLVRVSPLQSKQRACGLGKNGAETTGQQWSAQTSYHSNILRTKIHIPCGEKLKGKFCHAKNNILKQSKICILHP